MAERLLGEGGRECFADLTGGFGIDFSYMAPLFRHALYVEQQSPLCNIARHNFPLLGLQHAEVMNGVVDVSTINELMSHNACQPTADLVFLDPARRDDVGRKVVALEDCTPNVVTLQDALLHCARFVIVKLSPMLDITQALRSLHGVREVHVVSVQGECKELLLVLSGEACAETEKSVTYYCANLREGVGDDKSEGYGVAEKQTSWLYVVGTDELSKRTGEASGGIASVEEVAAQRYLYEPNASILKAGVQDTLPHNFGVKKLHPQSNLFISEECIEDFPGRRFRVVSVGDFSKRGVKMLLQDVSQANLTIRNFPSTVAQLRKQMKIKEGGDVYLFATTLSDGKHALVRCTK